MMTPEQANDYMKQKMGFLPRMFAVVNQLAAPGRTNFCRFLRHDFQ
jgi:hypothetical protein